MASTMMMIPTESALQHQQSLKSADAYRRELMIEYAWTAYDYVISPAEADEIIFEGLWEGVDDFVEYMLQANVGQAVPGTANLEHGMKVYSLEELDLMDAEMRAASGSDDDDGDYDYDSNSDEEEAYEYMYDDEEWSVMRMQLEELETVHTVKVPVITTPEDFEAEFDAEDAKEPLPLYTTDSPPAYPNPPTPGPPPYASLEEEVEEVETQEVIEESVEEIEAEEVEEPATQVEAEEECPESLPCEPTMTGSALVEEKAKSTGLFTAFGAHIDKAVFKTKSRIARVFRPLSSRKRGYRRTRRFSSSS